MHVLIVGCRGQLGAALCKTLADKADWTVTGWGRSDHDITHPAVADAVADLRPDLVVNAAAWTDVDGAESHQEAAYAVNALGAFHLATGCQRCGAALVQVSTNEVFAGAPGCLYREYDLPAPSGVYARSKLAGERAARQVLSRLYVVRVAWLFGGGTRDFPAKITAAADRHGQLRVVADEFGNPTYAPDAAEAMIRLVQSERYGIYHLVNQGCASRFDFAQAVLAASGRGRVPLTPIHAAEWLRPAPSPLHAVLANQTAAALGIELRPWQAALQDYARQLITESESP